MTILNKIPHSAIAVDNLVAIERKHKRKTYSNGNSLCFGELSDPMAELTYGPCPTLAQSRASASKETLIAVALILGGERR